MKIAMLTNILSPYRKEFFDGLHEKFLSENVEFTVFVMANGESNRNWKYDDYKAEYTRLLESKTFEVSTLYLHFNHTFKNEIKEYDPDILILSGSYTSPSVIQSVFMKKKLNCELLFWSESHLTEKRNYNKIKVFFREIIRSRFYKSIDGFLYAGEKSKELIMKYASKKANYFFIPNLIDERSFFLANELRKNKTILRNKNNVNIDSFVFLFPARLTSVKGIIPFLEIFKKYCDSQKVIILLPGDGELKSDIEKFILKEKLDIRLLGYLSQEKMIEMYAIADAFLLPSLSDPNPLSSIEALWSGLPLFLSEHVGNYPECVMVDENGYVFSYANETEVLSLIDSLVNKNKEWFDNANRVSLSIAQSLYCKEISINNLVHNLIEIYGEQSE